MCIQHFSTNYKRGDKSTCPKETGCYDGETSSIVFEAHQTLTVQGCMEDFQKELQGILVQEVHL